jgi:hypothetical protein
VSNRRVLNGTLWVLGFGAPGRDLPYILVQAKRFELVKKSTFLNKLAPSLAQRLHAGS